MSEQEIFPFADPNFTQVNNAVIDFIMPKCKPNTFKIIMATIRKTAGWHKEKDMISFSQYMKLTGIGSRETCSLAIQDALDKKYLIRSKHKNSYKYSLNKRYSFRTSTETVPKNGTETVHTKEIEINLIILKEFQKAWQNSTGRPLTPTEIDKLWEVFDEWESRNNPKESDPSAKDAVLEAIKITGLSAERKLVTYTAGIVNNWISSGYDAPKPGQKGKQNGKETMSQEEIDEMKEKARKRVEAVRSQ